MMSLSRLIWSIAAILSLGSGSMAQVELSCREGVTECCTEDNVENEIHSKSCQYLISENDVWVKPDQDFELTADAGFEVNGLLALGSCTWKLPNGVECKFTESDDVGTECDAYSSVVWNGDTSNYLCRIRIRNADKDIVDGTWVVEYTLANTYTDSVRVTVSKNDPSNNGLSTDEVVAITVPLSILVIAGIVILLICFLCPYLFLGCCAFCLCRPCREKAEKQDEERKAKREAKNVSVLQDRPLPNVVIVSNQDHRRESSDRIRSDDSDSEASRLHTSQMRTPTPPHSQHQQPGGRIVEHFRPGYEDISEHSSELESRPSSSVTNLYANRDFIEQPRRPNSGNYEAVTYSHVQPSPGDRLVTEQKTARKISNTASMQSFPGRQPQHQLGAKKTSVAFP